MRRRLLLVHAACVVLAGAGGTGHHLATAGGEDVSSPRTSAASPSSVALRSAPPGLPVASTTGDDGVTHRLVLHASGLVEAMQANAPFAVLSGSPLTASGDVSAASWRFIVGAAEPIVILKGRLGTVTGLVQRPATWTSPGGFNDDAAAVSSTLQRLIAEVHAKAATDPAYRPLDELLENDEWRGTVVFGASVPMLPSSVLGRSTGSLAGSPVPVRALWLDASAVASPSSTTSFGALIDHDGEAGSVRASFANSRLTSFAATPR